MVRQIGDEYSPAIVLLLYLSVSFFAFWTWLVPYRLHFAFIWFQAIFRKSTSFRDFLQSNFAWLAWLVPKLASVSCLAALWRHPGQGCHWCIFLQPSGPLFIVWWKSPTPSFHSLLVCLQAGRVFFWRMHFWYCAFFQPDGVFLC